MTQAKTLILLMLTISYSYQLKAQLWQSDLENGTYQNPVLYADYSDPDIVRVGDDFYMTASSFNCVPALPILHSKDLVNWQLINYAIKEFEDPAFDTPQHGNGVWAPAIRYHKEEFYIYYGDPDRGIFVVKTKDPQGDWEKPVLVKKAYGNIDPCPLWDDDGKVYMVQAFAHSRAGVNSILQVNKLSADGKRLRDKGKIVFDGQANHPTIEGPKFYKRNGYYYIFAPGGGVRTGWQTILRSKNIYGPYEDKIVLHQGNTNINGPHQGALVELENGESWFVHFQDKGAYGRIVHLQPVEWVNDWPMMGKDINSDGIGEPVTIYKKPNVGKNYPATILRTSDEFNTDKFGLQWQWHANMKTGWWKFDKNQGSLNLFSVGSNDKNMYLDKIPNLLLQKFIAPKFTATTRMTFKPETIDETAGLTIMGLQYSYIALCKTNKGISLKQYTGSFNGDEREIIKIEEQPYNEETIYLRVTVDENVVCNFSFSKDGKNFIPFGKPFKASRGKWIGAKTGIFNINPSDRITEGYATFDWFRVE